MTDRLETLPPGATIKDLLDVFKSAAASHRDGGRPVPRAGHANRFAVLSPAPHAEIGYATGTRVRLIANLESGKQVIRNFPDFLVSRLICVQTKSR